MGVTVQTQGVTTGEFNLNVTCEAITGTLDNVKSDFSYDITGLITKSDSCSTTSTVQITGGTATLEGDRPKISLNYTFPAGPGMCGIDNPGSSATLNLVSEGPVGNHLFGNSMDFTDPNIQMALDSLVKIGSDVQTSEHWELNTAGPALGEISPQYLRYFLQNIPVQNKYSVPVEWNNLPAGKVAFSLNGQSKDAALNGNTAEQSFEVGSLPAGKNPLTAVATAANGSTSSPAGLDVIIVPQPQWAQAAGFSGAPEGDHILYSGKVNFPEQPLQAAVSIPEVIPYLGGQWGLLPTQLTANLQATSLGGIKNGTFSGKGGVGLGASQFPLEVSGATYTEMGETELAIDKSTVYLSLPPVSFSKQMGLLNLIPGADALFGLPVIGKALQAANGIAAINGNVTTSLNGQADVEAKADQSALAFSSGKLSTAAQVTVGSQLDFGLAWAMIQGGGNGAVTYQVVPELKATDCAVNLTFTAAAGLAKFFHVQPAVYSQDWPLTQCTSTAYYSRKGLASRGMPSVAEFEPVAVSRQVPSYDSVAGTVLVPGADAHARPALAVSPDGKMAFTWMAVDTSSSSVQLRTYIDGQWGQAVTLSDTAFSAFTPAVGIDAQGRSLVLWAQSKSSTPPAALDEAYARSLEIHYALYDPAQGKVVEQGSLTGDSDLDFTPQIARSPDGSLWAAWQSSSAASLAGTADAPNSIKAARWDGKKWSKVETAAGHLVGTLYWNLAAGPKKAMIAYDADTDGDLSTASDREIFVVQAGSGWGKPRQVTQDQQVDSAPRAAFTPEGNPVLAWLSGQKVMGMAGSLDQQPAAWLDASQTGLGLQLGEGVLMAAANGQLLLALPGAYAQGSDVWLLKYDSATQQWNVPETPVFGSPALETALSAGLTANGDVTVGAASIPFELQPAQTSGSESAGAPQLSQTADLVVVQQPGVLPAGALTASSAAAGQPLPGVRILLLAVVYGGGLLVVAGVVLLIYLWKKKAR